MQIRSFVGPSEVHAHSPHDAQGIGRGAATVDDLLAAQAYHIERTLASGRAPDYVRPPHEASIARDAFINEGRLLLDCTCGSGVSVSVDWMLAACFECGAIYRGKQIVLPPRLAEVDALLVRLPMGLRSFYPAGETVEMLARRIDDLTKGRG